MHDKTDPWSGNRNLDPFAAAAMSAADANAIAEAHFAEREPRRVEPYRPGPGMFVGPETDPATGGPNWEQGPRQLP